MPRLLLLLPTLTYRTEAFLEAASRLAVEITVGCNQTQALAPMQPSHNVTLDFLHPEEAARIAGLFARRYPIDAVVGVDDDTAVAAAAISEALRLPHNSVESTLAAKNKHLMREILSRHGVPVPHFILFSRQDDPALLADRVSYPCVLKPLILAASRGVIRADNSGEFVSAFRRIETILRQPEVAARDEPARRILVEDFIPGQEVALEGMLTKGNLQVLALFDKPDPLDGPFFEETIYVTPSRHPAAVQDEIVSCAARTATALGLREGPVHAELRFNSQGVWMIEMAARSIGGLCSRILRFGAGLSLEDLILRHALGMEIESMERERQPAGVMMLPIPQAGILRQVNGKEEAEAVPGIVEVAITAHLGQELVPLPEGARYLGFIFARAESPDRVEASLREAQRRLQFTIEPLPVEARA